MQLRTLHALLTITALLVMGFLTGCSDSPSASGDLTISPAANLYAESPLPIYVAFRDGNGPWQRLQIGSNGVFTAPVSNPDGRYTVLMVMDHMMQASTRGTQASTRDMGYGDVLLVQATLREVPFLTYGIADSNANDSPYTVSGSISNAPEEPGQYLEVRMGRYGMWSGYPSSTSYQLYNPPTAGTWDLVAYTRSSLSFMPERFLMQRNITMQGNLVRNLDFGTTVAAEYAQLTLESGGWGDTYAYVDGITANGTELTVSEFIEDRDTVQFAKLPGQVSGDLYRVYSQANNKNAWVQLTTWHTLPENATITLPEEFTSAMVDYDGVAPVIHGLQYSSDIYGTTKGYVARLYGVDANNNWHQWHCFITPGALRSATSVALPAPDSLPGWNTAWSMPTDAGLDRDWRVYAVGGTVSVHDIAGLYLQFGSSHDVPHGNGTALYIVSCEDDDDRSVTMTRGSRRGAPLFGE